MTTSQRFRKKPVEITASQWFKNGDHSEDNLPPNDKIVNGERTEGAVVRYFRYPSVDPETGEISTAVDAVNMGRMRHSETPAKFRRDDCHYPMGDHGWIDTREGGHTVCPGDWIITGVMGERYPCKPDIFTATYEPVSDEPEITP